MKRILVWIVAILCSSALALVVFAWTGRYDIAADEPHWGVTARLLTVVRDRSIKARAADLTVPNLADPALVALGAEHYAAMCIDCHLAPGMDDTEQRRGLNPKPPNLSEKRVRGPAESFWIIKHGIKMSGMPAWGMTHDDDSIWGLVAFLQELPTLDEAGYVALTEGVGDSSHPHDEHEQGPGTGGVGSHDSAADARDETTRDGTASEAVHAHEHAAGEGHDH